VGERRLQSGIDDIVATGLSSAHPVHRAMARLVATGAIHSIAEWGNAEMARPETHPADTLLALGHMLVQTFGSFAGSMAPAKTHPDIVRLFVELVQKQLPPHLAAVRAAQDELEKADG
jgi:hypothetical protein